MSDHPIRLFALACVALLLFSATARPDEIHLRDGTLLKGQIMRETPEAYLLVAEGGAMRNIPRTAVRLTLYDTPQKAEQYLDLEKTRRLCQDPSSVAVEILPTQAFAQAALESICTARTSIWISAYYISTSQGGAIRSIFDALKEKGESGLDVRILCENSTATAPSVRNANRNTASQLAIAGIRTFFLGSNKAQHKKMILVDGNTLIFGSSNLSLAGTSASNELNIRTRQHQLIKCATDDFLGLLARATPLEELDKPN